MEAPQFLSSIPRNEPPDRLCFYFFLFDISTLNSKHDYFTFSKSLRSELQCVQICFRPMTDLVCEPRLSNHFFIAASHPVSCVNSTILSISALPNCRDGETYSLRLQLLVPRYCPPIYCLFLHLHR